MQDLLNSAIEAAYEPMCRLDLMLGTECYSREEFAVSFPISVYATLLGMALCWALYRFFSAEDRLHAEEQGNEYLRRRIDQLETELRLAEGARTCEADQFQAAIEHNGLVHCTHCSGGWEAPSDDGIFHKCPRCNGGGYIQKLEPVPQPLAY